MILGKKKIKKTLKIKYIAPLKKEVYKNRSPEVMGSSMVDVK